VTQVLQKRRVRTSGGEVAYAEAGDPAAPVLLLLHGFPLSSFQWRDLMPLFASRFRVIAPDQLGSGDSEKPAAVALDGRAQAGYVRELLAELAVERFAVVGHGSGGIVARRLALAGDGVDALVLLAPTDPATWPAEVIDALETALRGDHADPTAVRTALRLGSRRSREPSEDVMAEYERPFSDPAGAAALSRLLEAHRRAAPEETGGEASFDAPALIMWGEDDPFGAVAEAERLSDSMPSSALGLLPGCGHYLVEEAADTIGPMIHEYLRARYLHTPHGHDDTSGVVRLQLERRPPWVDLEEDEADDWFDVDGGDVDDGKGSDR
jgi:pimeloyl-ACP methyl ester carboxylesterase